MAVVLVLARRALERPGVAVTLVVLALAVTAWTSMLLRRDHARLCRPPAVGAEIAVALALQVADGFVYRQSHVFSGEQPLGVAWPIAGVLASGIAFGPLAGAGTGVVIGLGRAVSSFAYAPEPTTDVVLLGLEPVQLLSLVTTTVMYALAGGAGGHAMRLIRRGEQRIAAAERDLADARARDAVGRRLHDGVLQTLALVQRRSDDPQLVDLAQEQDRDLRRFLFGPVAGGQRGSGATETGDPARIAENLREMADRHERTFTARVEVLVPDDLPALPERTESALLGAVGEALNNVGKHAAASRVVVYLEPGDGEVFCSVRDDGVGFDPATAIEGIGLTRSVRARIGEVGGSVEVDSAVGRGTEVRLTVPLSPPP